MTQTFILIGTSGESQRIVCGSYTRREMFTETIISKFSQVKEFCMDFYKYLLISVAIIGVIFTLIIVGYLAGFALAAHEQQNIGISGYCTGKECTR